MLNNPSSPRAKVSFKTIDLRAISKRKKETPNQSDPLNHHHKLHGQTK